MKNFNCLSYIINSILLTTTKDHIMQKLVILSFRILLHADNELKSNRQRWPDRNIRKGKKEKWVLSFVNESQLSNE